MCRIFVPKTKTRHIFMADNTILNRLDGLKLKYEETGQKLTDPEVIADVKQFIQLTKEYKELEPIIETSERYRTAIANLAEAKDTLATDKDEEMREMAREMIAELEPQLEQMEEEIKLLLIPKPYLYAGITVFCALGIYATSGEVFDLLMLLGVGVLGFLMRLHGYPLAPLVIGMVLGPLAETNLRDALISSDGNAGVLVDSPIALGMYAVLLVVLAIDLVVEGIRALGRNKKAAESAK